MNRLFFFCVWLCFFTKAVLSQDTVLVWNENMKFGWEYYTGKRPEWKKNTMAVASTCYDLSYDFPSVDKVKVEAHFHSDCSWVLPDFKTPDILAHEKLHFDIVELFARKLRKKILEAVFTDAEDARKKIKAWHKQAEKEMDRFQDLYDEETNGSMNAEMQKWWNSKIFLELNALKIYSNSAINLNVKPIKRY